jgi:hypothetical protein
VPSERDPLAETVEAALAPGRPMTLEQIAEALGGRARSRRRARHRVGPARILHLLRAHPEWFVEVAPGVWVRRRDDGPGAGFPSRLPRPPLAGGAAAAAVPPREPVSVDAVGRTWVAPG